jgi:hypothetical protein
VCSTAEPPSTFPLLETRKEKEKALNQQQLVSRKAYDEGKRLKALKPKA